MQKCMLKEIIPWRAAQTPSGVWSAVAFVYAGFGLAFFESTPNDPVGALRSRLRAVFYYILRLSLFGKVTYFHE